MSSTNTESPEDPKPPTGIFRGFGRVILAIDQFQRNVTSKLEPWFSITMRLAPWGAIIVLIIAIKTDHGVVQSIEQIKEASAKLDSLMPMLDTISSSVSTQYLDTFPANIAAIIELIERVQPGGTLKVMCDMPAYGSVSAPALFNKLKTAYKHARDKDVRIGMTMYNDSLREHFTHMQFGSQPFVDVLKHPLIHGWLDNRGLPLDLTERQFYHQLELEEQQTLAHFRDQCRVKVKYADAPLPFFCWIADGREAIISFWGFQGSTVAELTFRTRDPKMIAAVEKVVGTVTREDDSTIRKPAGISSATAP